MLDTVGADQQDVVIPIEGAFHPMAAAALRTRIGTLRSAARLVIDFTRAREVSDLAIAVLAHGLVSDRVAVRLRGLSQHHERMLRYLGIEVAAMERPA
jgi:hypothetical protein